MIIFLVFIAFLFPLAVNAEEIRVLDHVCVSESIRRCMGNFAGHPSSATCPAGSLPVPEGSGDKTYGEDRRCISLQRPDSQNQVHGGIVNKRDSAITTSGKPLSYAEEVARFEWCEKVVLYTLAEQDSCIRKLPSADHFEAFNNNFQTNFRQALEKAFPPKAAESSAPPTPTPAPAKP